VCCHLSHTAVEGLPPSPETAAVACNRSPNRPASPGQPTTATATPTLGGPLSAEASSPSPRPRTGTSGPPWRRRRLGSRGCSLHWESCRTCLIELSDGTKPAWWGGGEGSPVPAASGGFRTCIAQAKRGTGDERRGPHRWVTRATSCRFVKDVIDLIIAHMSIYGNNH